MNPEISILNTSFTPSPLGVNTLGIFNLLFGTIISIVLQTDPGYIDLILKSDFSKDTKLWVQKLRKVFLDKKSKNTPY